MIGLFSGRIRRAVKPRDSLLMRKEPASHYARLPVRIAAIYARARCGHVLEQVQWGQILLDSVYVPRRPDLAFRWFSGAAQAGFGPGFNMLGRCFQFGWGCKVDALRAAAHYEQAAVHGDVWGCYNLAILTLRGIGVTKDLARALSLFRAGAEAGHAKSMNLYARFLEEGWETKPDREQAEIWYRRSAQAGDYRGQHNFATLLSDRQEIRQALVWWRKAVNDASSDILLAMHARLTVLGVQGDPVLLASVAQRLAGLERRVRLPEAHETVS